jgi:hypothetical protein
LTKSPTRNFGVRYLPSSFGGVVIRVRRGGVWRSSPLFVTPAGQVLPNNKSTTQQPRTCRPGSRQ